MKLMNHKNMKSILYISLILGTSLFISSCGDSDRHMVEITEPFSPEPAVETEIDETKINDAETTALSEISIRLLTEIMMNETEGQTKNLLISPYSVFTALGMTGNGAAGDTLSSIQETVFGGIPIDRLNSILYTSRKKMQDNKEVDFHIANSIWVNDEKRVTPDEAFAEKVKSYYQTDMFLLPFDNAAIDTINSWVNKHTNKMIPSIINHISDEQVIFLINAMAFEGKWEENYEKTDIEENCDFVNAKGETETVTMLHSVEFNYIELGGGTGFVKYYKGGEYAFVGILPPEGMSNAEYLNHLKTEGLDFSQSFQNRKNDCDVIVTMPEFSYDYDIELTDILKNLGMEEAFCDAADFSAMVTADSEPVFIDSIIHKTHIEVDRTGTKAAAVTSVAMNAAGAAPESTPVVVITLDRPFVYGIVDTATGLPIFIGCTNSINQ